MVHDYSFLENMTKNSYVWFEDNRTNNTDIHTHSVAQFVYVAKGFQYLHTSQNVYLLPQHFAAWIPAHTPHKMVSEANDLHLRSLFYKETPLHSFYNTVHIFSVPLLLREMIMYCEKWNKNGLFSENEAVFLQAILSELPHFSENTLQLQLSTPKDINLRLLCNYIHLHFDKEFTLSELASQFYFSERSLQRLFKKETGITLAKYIQYIRVMKSIEWLGSGQYTVSETAFKAGYKSLQAFSSSFYEVVKQRPTAFLNR